MGNCTSGSLHGDSEAQRIISRHVCRAFLAAVRRAEAILDLDDKADQLPAFSGTYEGSHAVTCCQVDRSMFAKNGTSASSSASYTRHSCRYGRHCYRGTTVHLNKFAHPRDPDYNPARHVPLKPQSRVGRFRRIEDLILLRAQGDVFASRFKFNKRLNGGPYCITCVATHSSTERTVVVKKPSAVKDIGVIEALMQKPHEHVVRVLDLFCSPWETCIITQYCAGGDLFTALSGLGAPTQNWCAAVFRQAVRGLMHLHERFERPHGGIRPENILLAHVPTETAEVPRVMIGDFCSSVSQSLSAEYQKIAVDPRYAAPEVVETERVGFEADSWSLGATLFEILSGGQTLYLRLGTSTSRNISGWPSFASFQNGRSYRSFLDSLKSRQPVDLSVIHGRMARELLVGLLDTDPIERFDLHEALQEPWFDLDVNSVPLSIGTGQMEMLNSRCRCRKIRNGLLELVGTKLKNECALYYWQIWTRYDVEGKGVLAFEEFEKMVEEHALLSGPAEPLLRNIPFGSYLPLEQLPSVLDLFRMADCERNNLISFSDFSGMMINTEAIDDCEKMQYFESALKFVADEAAGTQVCLKSVQQFFVGQDTAVIYQLFREADCELLVDRKGRIEYSKLMDFVKEL